MNVKTTIIKSLIVACVSASLVGLSGRACADDPAPVKGVPENTRTYAGNVKSVDDKERTIIVEAFWSTKTFAAGDHCKVQLEDKPNAVLKDLRAGYRVEVQFVSKDGVKIASHISQRDSTYTGHVSTVDAAKRTFVVKSGLGSKTFVAADDCKIIIRDEKSTGLADLKTGHKVTVHYASIRPENVAHKVEQGSLTFSGTVEAIDATTGTLKAKKAMTNRRFRIGDDCPIIVDGRAGGKLSDLRIGDKLSFDYEDVDGVLVASRIARENSASAPAPSPEQFTRTE
jgi:Cu/Ag efflux protein CusF